jgi:F0F1-type ATP synthase epsilon subunit
MIAASSLQLVLVTPEKTLLNEPVAALRFPLYDGQIGILPGRLPLIDDWVTGVEGFRSRERKGRTTSTEVLCRSKGLLFLC